ncbi:MAG: T9SS type A sorting domain-containing protein, partial [Bacteroidota bacterium]
ETQPGILRVDQFNAPIEAWRDRHPLSYEGLAMIQRHTSGGYLYKSLTRGASGIEGIALGRTTSAVPTNCVKQVKKKHLRALVTGWERGYREFDFGVRAPRSSYASPLAFAPISCGANKMAAMAELEADEQALIFPNPAQRGSDLNIVPTVDEGLFSLRIVDAMGRTVREMQQELKGKTTLRLELGDLPAGAYHVLIQEGASTRKATLMIQ